jgi:hypothetical protein
MNTSTDENGSAEMTEGSVGVEIEVDLLTFSSTEIDHEHGDEVQCAVRLQIEEDIYTPRAA